MFTLSLRTLWFFRNEIECPCGSNDRTIFLQTKVLLEAVLLEDVQNN